jgi:RNA polymerase sigma-70 factor, ECF subfamily
LREPSKIVLIIGAKTNFAKGEPLSNQSKRLESLLDAGGRHLYSLLVRLTLREDVADDLLQELVVRLSQSNGFQQADDPLSYARRVAIHLAFDWYRQKKRQGKIEGLLEEPSAVVVSPLNMLIACEDYKQILANMEQLSELSRTCIVLHYVEQLSYIEIAEQLGTTSHKIRGVCHKGIRRLQQLMGISSKKADTKGGAC